jgi:hypothetical protein
VIFFFFFVFFDRFLSRSFSLLCSVFDRSSRLRRRRRRRTKMIKRTRSNALDIRFLLTFFLLFFFEFRSNEGVRAKTRSPAKEKLKKYELVQFERVYADDAVQRDGNPDSNRSLLRRRLRGEEEGEEGMETMRFKCEVFKKTFEIEFEKIEGFERSFQVYRYDSRAQRAEVDEETTKKAREIVNECAYKGTVVGSKFSRVTGILCRDGGYAHVNALSREMNISVSFMLPHDDFADEVRVFRERKREERKLRRRNSRRALLLLNGGDDDVDDDDDLHDLESLEFVAFNAEDEVAEDDVGEARDRVIEIPTNNDYNDNNDNNNKRRRKLNAINYSTTRVVEVYVHSDLARTEKYATALDCVMDSISIMNYVKALYENVFDPNIKIVIKAMAYTASGSLDPWGSITKGSCSDCTSQEIPSETLLIKAGDWKNNINPSNALYKADVLTIFSGSDFDSGTIGLAYRLGMCDKRSSVNVNEVFRENSLRYSAATVAHEIGHNLGFEHDGVSDDCPDTGLIMAAKAGYELETEWSTCSVDKYKSYIGLFNCLKSGDDNVCGNGIVEDGEECDCYENDCSNASKYGTEATCCNAQTCKLNTGKQCSSYHDGCCNDSCAIKSNGAVCREAVVGGCDVQESCDGVTKSCSVDVWKPYGSYCAHPTYPNDIGSCFKNECRNTNYWCQALDPTSFGGFCISKVSFPAETCSTKNFKCYNAINSCFQSHVFSTVPNKGYPCSVIPNDTVAGIFSKVCDGIGNCIDPSDLDDLRGPQNDSPSTPAVNDVSFEVSGSSGLTISVLNSNMIFGLLSVVVLLLL